MYTIYMLCLRQLKRYVRVKARIIGALGQPLIFLLVLGFGFGPIYAKANGGNYLQMLVPGIILMGILFNAVITGMDIIWDRQFGFLKAILVAPVSRFQLVIAQVLGGSLVAFLQGCLVFIICLCVGYKLENVRLIPLAMLAMYFNAIFAASLGTIIGSALKDMQSFPIIMNFFVTPMIGLSGAYFPVNGLGAGMKLAVYCDPLSYGVDLFKTLLGQPSFFGIYLDIGILGSVTAILLLMASYLFSKIEIE